MTMKLTKFIIKELIAEAVGTKKQGHRLDSEVTGFLARAYPSGNCVFRFQYRIGGRAGVPRGITIGEFRDPPRDPNGSDTVEGARRIAAGYRGQFIAGEDPAATLKAKKAEAVETARKESEKAEGSGDPETVQELVNAYLESPKGGARKRDGGEGDKRTLKADVVPSLGASTKIAAVHKRDVVKAMNKAIDRKSPVMANHILRLTRRLFNFAISEGLLTVNPCDGIEQLEELPRERVLSAEEIPLWWRALDNSSMGKNLRELLRFLLVTGRRKSEALFINDKEIDHEAGIWTIKARTPGRSKRGKKLVQPLTPMALGILKGVGIGNGGFYFVNPKTGEPYAERTVDHAMKALFVAPKGKKKNRKNPPPLASMEYATPHDLRRTADTQMIELGVNPDITRRILGHSDGTTQGKHYDHAKVLPALRHAYETWERYLKTLLDPKRPSNVVQMTEASGGARTGT